jgi:hypothetical protein
MPKREQRRERKRVANLPGYSSERETAEKLGVNVRALREWRRLGKGPPFTKFAHEIQYRDAAVTAWLLSREVRPVREQAAA